MVPRDAAAPVRSVHLNTETGFRGGEVQTLGLVRHMAALGQPVTLLCPPGSELARRATGAGLRVIPFRALGEWDLVAVLRLRLLLSREGAQVVHAHTSHALSLALAARGGAGRFLVVGSRRVSFPLRTRLSAKKWANADAVVAVSHSIGVSLVESGVPEGRVRVIHSGVDLGRFTSAPTRAEARRLWELPEEGPVLGVVSALSHHKGVGVFMKAFPKVWTELPAVRAVVAGDGDLLNPLRCGANNLNLPVTFLGFLPEPAALLPALDALVLPSLSGEGSPGVVKEAAAAGVPVVATDVGGTAEILRPEREALIVPAGEPSALAQGILRILGDAVLAERLRQAALERVRSFSMEAMADATLALYRELLSGGAGSR